MNQYKSFKDRPVAYFCAEYALFDYDSLYAGGLGILSGDYVNAIIKEKFPAVAIGLFYYTDDELGTGLDAINTTPDKLGMKLVNNSDGSVLKIPILLGNDKVFIRAWLYEKGDFRLFLLDTHLEENNKEYWSICDTLYDDNRLTRLRQEIILGIGGIKLLNKLGICPSVYHMNEGHSSFLAFELIMCEMEKAKKDFVEAVKCARKHIVFTNHTLVPAGQEMFDIDAMKSIFSEYFKNKSIKIDDLINLGIDKERNMFSMTLFALNMSSKVNSVSKKHLEEALKVWKGYNVTNVTNGIDIDRWDSFKYYSHKELKRKLIEYICMNSNVDINDDTLIIGWARRFADYKRPTVILKDVKRLKEIYKKTNGKFVIVFSSALNETYTKTNNFLKEIYDLMDKELKDIVIFLPNYDMKVSKYMISGCDVWLNTPIVGREACGTSGMKACLNGVLPFTTKDGWIDEIDISSMGWIIEDGENITNNLLDTLENNIIPEFFEHKERWDERMKSSRKMILDKFSAERMLREYIQNIYIPSYNDRDNV